MSLTVLILTKNEEEMIGKCIDSVFWAEEIIVVDSESKDKTRQIAEKKGAKVIIHPFKDFADQRNFALKQAKTDWVLYLDADEQVSAPLTEEIQVVVGGPSQFSAYRLQRRNFYFSRQWPHDDKLERLFKRASLKEWFGAVHESPQVECPIGDLKQPLYHFTHRNITAMLDKTIEWSAVEARLRFKAGHPPVTWWRILRVAASGFFNSYVSQRGFLVGTVGLIESIYQAFSMFITYTRLWEMQQTTKK